MFCSGGGRSMPGRSKTLGPGFMKSGSIGSFFLDQFANNGFTLVLEFSALCKS